MELEKAFLAVEATEAAYRLIDLPEDRMYEVFDASLGLPKEHRSMRVPLPEVLPPEMKALRDAIDSDNPDLDEYLRPALHHVDKPRQRATLVRAALALAEDGTVDPYVVDAAVLDLDSPDTSALLVRSLLESISASGSVIAISA